MWVNEEGDSARPLICLGCLTIREKTDGAVRYLPHRQDATEADWTPVEPPCEDPKARGGL